MKLRMMARNGCFALAILIIVAACLTFWPHQITPASAAGKGQCYLQKLLPG